LVLAGAPSSEGCPGNDAITRWPVSALT